ncbi:MAG: enoyl-CoA hydratase/isomerase family protein [Chloroflexi bacterium]|nr:enoyl-CoA hydratase/isomerase family protein [Chloroflexota bacterium]
MNDYSRYAEVDLLVKVEDHIATITINRPERMNATNPAIHQGLEEILIAFNHDERVRCVILTGAGERAFSAGGDVKVMAKAAEVNEPPKTIGGILRGGKWIIHDYLNCEVPTIAAINGDAAGFGATLALMCDITIMAETARIGDTHVRMGLVAGDGGALMWPFLIGMNRAKEMLMTGRLLKAHEALKYGLVNHVVPQGQVMPKALELAKELVEGAPMAIRWTKSALNQRIWQEVVSTHHYCAAVESLTAICEDKKEAALAFAQKRKGNYRNR